MNDASLLIIPSGLSLLSLLGFAYFAGQFSQKITVLEAKVAKQAELSSVDKDFHVLKESIEKDFKALAYQLEEVKEQIRNVRTDFTNTIGKNYSSK